ncbi:biotin--[acetyl-CoA-carboxylase] ligase [Celeribacter neptunius]|uniref:biotin--[biotin carboxyl-carrier protein] ligase n=1 Tax=Celeribacter neptunius TaxID=588602 RepID=A0A1I3JAZ4_9RHOB|nr:biotin--[acetyl-CoA-carboxylase] ligase [Celeribacter neptunius]SFI57424.1 BirA family transcriptional regulator, biotin operon repressor / biotin-[acetyl-CoA-carboxylase] ligase [Celeribacter neptunius]
MYIWPDGVGRTVLPSVDSTMSEAARVAASSTFPQWILAHSQTAAHGRRGRPWVNPVGNFSATLLMFPTEPPELVALRSFVASLALYDAFVAVTGRTDPFALKWPNDVLLNGGKVAGILLERGSSHLAIGIGVNLAEAPERAAVEEGAAAPVSLAHETGALVQPEEFLDQLAPAFAHWEAQFTTYGFAPIRTAWLARAARLGEPIRARTMAETHHGTFETVDAFGNLVLATPKGKLSIPAAEVYF